MDYTHCTLNVMGEERKGERRGEEDRKGQTDGQRGADEAKIEPLTNTTGFY